MTTILPAFYSTNRQASFLRLVFFLAVVGILTGTGGQASAQCRLPNFEAGAVGDTESCDPINFGYKLTAYLDNPATTVYNVDFGDGNTVELTQADLDPSGTHIIEHTYEKVTCELNAENNFYTVIIEATRSDCEVAAPRTVQISPVIIGKAPDPSFTFDPDPACVNGVVTFSNTTEPGYNFDCSTNSTYIWDFGDGSPTITTTTEENVEHIYRAEGQYEITLTVLHDCGDRIVTKTILVSDIPIPKFDITETLADGTFNTLTVDTCMSPAEEFVLLENLCAPITLDLKNLSEGDSLVYIWEVEPTNGALFGNGDMTSENPDETITFTEAGEYLITLRAENSCGFEQSCVRVNVVDVPSPDNVEILGLENLCSPATLDLSVEIPTATDFAWTIKGVGATPDPPAFGGADTADPNPITLPTGVYEVSVTVTNACGTGTATETIEVVDPPTVSIDASALEICAGETVVTLTADADVEVTFQWFLDGEAIPGATQATYETSTAGTYTVEVNRGGNCLVASAPVTLIDKPKPEALITSSDPDAYCEGQPISTLLEGSDGPGLTYQWLLDGVIIPGATDVTYLATQIGADRLETTLDGCSELSEPFVIRSLPLPTVGVTSFRPDICIGESTTLEATGALEYSWSPAEGLNRTNGNIVQANPLVTTTYTVTGTSVNGCTSTNTITVVVNPLPVIALSATELEICAGGVSEITASGTDTYRWEAHPSLSAEEGAVVTVNPLQTTTYRVTGIDANGCEVNDSITIQVKPLPDVIIEDEEVCIYNDPFVLAADPQVPGTGTWSSPDLPAGALTPDGLFNPQIAGENVGGHTILYTFVETGSATNCENVFSKRVFVYPPPEPLFETDSLICVNTEVTFTSMTEDRDWENLTFEWRFGDGGVIAGESATYIFTDVADVMEVTLIATSQAGCVDSLTQEVGIVAPPQPSFILNFTPADSCGPLTVNFDNTSIGRGLSYAWDFGNGFTSDVANPEAQVYPSGIYNDTTYYITLSVSNVCETVEYLDSVKVKASPISNFVFELDTVCSNYPMKLFNYAVGEPNNFTWDFGDGSAPFVTQDTGFVQHNFIYTGVNDTTYNITLIAENDCGADTLTRPLVVVPNTVTSFFNVNTDNGCAPLTVNFNSNQTGRNAMIWFWGDDPDNYETGGLNQSYTYTDPGVYQAQLVVISGCNIDTFSREITVYPGPNASFDAEREVCLGQPATIINTSPQPYETRWEFGDGTTFNGVNPPPKTYAAPGEYVISMFVTDPISGCIQRLEQTINVRPFPIPDFQVPDDPICQGQPLQFTNLTTGAQSFYWDFGTKSAPSLDESPMAVIEESGIVRVTMVAFSGENLTGCSDTLTKTINLLPEPRPDFRFSTEVVCGVMTATFENLTTFPADESEGQLLWIFGNGNTYEGFDEIPPQVFQNLSESDEANYNITLRATTNAGCVQEYTETLTFNACCKPKLFLPEDGKSFAFTPFNGGQNEEFRIKMENVETFEMKIFNKWGQMVFQTDDPELGWDGTFEGQKCETGLYQVKVEYSGCRFGEVQAAEPKVVQLYLLD